MRASLVRKWGTDEPTYERRPPQLAWRRLHTRFAHTSNPAAAHLLTFTTADDPPARLEYGLERWLPRAPISLERAIETQSCNIGRSSTPARRRNHDEGPPTSSSGLRTCLNGPFRATQRNLAVVQTEDS
jgi:hypothetical protein